MSLSDDATRGVAWSAVRRWGSRTLGVVGMVVLARLLAPEVFGLMAMVQVYLAVVEVAVRSGMDAALVQRDDLTDTHCDSAFWTTCALGLVLGVGSWAVAGGVATLYGSSGVAPVLRWMACTVPITAFGVVPRALLRRDLAYDTLTRASLGSEVLAMAVGIALAAYDAGVWALVAMAFVGQVVRVVWLWAAAEYRPGSKLARPAVRSLWSYGLPMMGGQFTNILNRKSDDFVVGLVLGAGPLGYYTIAYRVLTSLTDLFLRVVDDVSFPVFSRLRDDRTAFREAFFTATRSAAVLGIPAFLGVFVLAPDVVRTLFGRSWMPATPVIQVLAITGVVQATALYMSTVVDAAGRPAWNFWLSGAGGVINVALFWLAAPFGIVAVAAAYGLRAVVFLPLRLWMTRLLLPFTIRRFFHQVSAPFLCAALMAGGVWVGRLLLLPHLPAAFRLPLLVLLGVLLYAGILSRVRPVLWDEARDRLAVLLPS